MSIDKIISETIYHGNPFEAIELNFFSCQEYIDYLAKYSNDIPIQRLQLSFCALMRFYPSTYHYSNGKHLLTYFPKDSVIQRFYVIMGGSPELHVTKEDSNNTLWSLIFDVYIEFINDIWSEEIEKCMLLCNKITPKLLKKELIFKDKDFLKDLHQYRCDKVLSMLPTCGIPTKEFEEYSIDYDWFDQYPVSILNYYGKYIERIGFLKKEAPEYFQKMLEHFIQQLSSITLNEFEKIDFPLLMKTCEYFPQQFSNIEVAEPYRRISIYPIGIRSYVLGLSCFPKMPSAKQLDDALISLATLGIDNYVNLILSKQQLETYSTELIANEKDTLFETPEDYVSLDRLNIEENGKIYQFTRPEFKKLYSDKKNFWTKQPLSYSDLYTLQLRIQLCKTLNLPTPDTLKVLIEKACKGCLYEEILEKDNTETATNNQTNQSLLYLYQLWLTNPSIFTNLNLNEEQESSPA